MTKTLTALAAAATLAIAAVAAPHPAEAGGGALAAGIIGGLAAGAIIGSAPAPYYDYGYDYDDGCYPGSCYVYRPVYAPSGRYLGRHLVDMCE